MTQDLAERFRTIAQDKLDQLQEHYNVLSIIPAKAGDLEQYRRHNMFKALLTHIVTLQKLLGVNVAHKAGDARYYTETELDAMLAELREARDD